MFSRRPLSEHSDSRSRGSHSRPGDRAAKPWVAPDCGQRATSHTDMPALDAMTRLSVARATTQRSTVLWQQLQSLDSRDAFKKKAFKASPTLAREMGRALRASRLPRLKGASRGGENFSSELQPDVADDIGRCTLI